MLGVLKKLFDSNDSALAKFQPIIDKANSIEPEFKKLKDAQFPKKTQEFRNRLEDGEDINKLMPEAFALVREASRRTLGMRHYDVQLLAASVLATGGVAEQKTGEGKTLSATPALYINALTGKGVHLVTVNDYLARRDAGWMAPMFKFLGMTTASIINDRSYIFDPEYSDENAHDYRLKHLRTISRKEAYQCDVVYGINSEFGFDYLRDNMAQDVSQLSQREYHFAVVDEVDSVLIDEARTPHIISAPDESPSARYYEYAKLVDKLNSSIDYKIDEKFRTAHLTDHGIGKIEKLFGISNIYEKDFDTVYHLEAALKARTLFHREKDYIVKDNQVILVDEFTGRLLPGRRLSEGLHQAIEAKESVPIQRESKTLATVSLQNYFRMYNKLSGMTGTALTEAEEFKKIYKLDVFVIPTNKQTIRKDLNDAVYKTTRAKLTAVANEIEKAHKIGQPVLVGTTSIDRNEIISELLTRRKIKHEVLNAKNHLQEAEIIAKAGRIGAVTVATNMAGRGVDIILGGESPKEEDGSSLTERKEWKNWEKEHNQVVELGGLFVIGTERHESRRIDNQLRGRSGRQGDPGSSRFFVALEDDIMRIFGGDRISGLMGRMNMPEDVPIEHGLISKAIENAQIKVEKFHFDSRKHLLEYDDVLNKQREIVYKRRRKALFASVRKSQETKTEDEEYSLREDIIDNIKTSIASLVELHEEENKIKNSPAGMNEAIVKDFVTIIPFDEHSQSHLIKQIQSKTEKEEKIEHLTNLAIDIYKKREKDFGEDSIRQIEKFVTLTTIDNLWMTHLDSIKHLEEGIRLQAYAQKDPLVEYKNEAYKMFEKLLFSIDDEIAHRVYRFMPKLISDAPLVQPKNIQTNTPESEVGVKTNPKIASSKPTVTDKSSGTTKKLGRNDPCHCGSGKKYKKCHYPN